LSAHAKAVQQQRELDCSCQSSAAAEGACLLIPNQCSSRGSLSSHTKAVQQQRELVCSYQSSAAAQGACWLLAYQCNSIGNLSVDTNAMQQLNWTVSKLEVPCRCSRASVTYCGSQEMLFMSCTLGVCVDILFACDSNSSDLAGRQQLPMVTLYTLFELVRFLESAGFPLTNNNHSL
jgi:hypothetical protein